MSRRRPSFTLRRTVCWPVIASLPLLPLTVLADMPRGGTVSGGRAVISAPAPGTVRIDQSSGRAVIRWDRFDIGRNNSVVFAQPGAGSATLNIVTGGAGSTLAGSLRANGSVYLVNPYGIAITPSGKVDTAGGFIASTLSISDADFMGGRLLFTGPGGAVRNDGVITIAPGGAVALLGGTVANAGVIRAPLGQVALGSARKATLDLSGDGFLQVLVPAGAQGADGQPLVSNSGVIEADGGTVLLKAATLREAVREAVHMPGEVRARSVSGRDGAIVFDGGAGGAVQVTGRVDASATGGATEGGRIDITGNAIALRGATVLAGGPQQGGLVRIGGGYQGGHAAVDAKDAQDQQFAGRHDAGTLRNSATTLVDAGSRIDVSATGHQGTGGTAIVWSEQATRMEGAVQATGARSGGAVEISSKSKVQSLVLDRVRIGPGGTLLLDPQDLVIGSGSGPDPEATYVTTASIVDQLKVGTNVALQTSNDIDWSSAFVFVTPTGVARAGNLRLAAGRSVRLDGAFNTGLGDWTIIGNDTAANGVDPALRGMGPASIDLMGASFVNSNGKLRMTLADGTGNGNGLADGSKGTVDAIRVGPFSGDALTAEIVPTAVGEYGAPRVQLYGTVDVANAVTLTGNLQVANSSVQLAGRTVDWTNEKTGATITGEGTVRFVADGVTTRIGKTGGSDATRLELGSAATVTRVYGDADPDQAALGAAALRVAAHNTVGAADALGEVFAAGSLQVTGPGVTANVGARTLQVRGGSGAAFKPVEYDADFNTVGGASGTYFVDLTAGTVAMNVTPRALTASVLAPTYTYGSPAAAATLAGIVNGDAIRPTATVAGTAVTMLPNGAGFGFAPNLDAGTHTFTLTGMSGARASNYTLDLTGVGGGSVAISPKPITYTGAASSQSYGTALLPSLGLNGLLAGDTVTPGTESVTVVSSGQTGGSGARPVGSYQVGVRSLAGADSGNYVIAGSGNTPAQVTVTAKPITWQVAADVASVYGTAASGVAANLGGIVAGDAISPVVVANGGAIGPRLDARDYTLAVNGLTGTGSGNYQLATSGNTSRTLSVARKPLTYGGSVVTQVYGQADAAAPVLQGVEAGDQVAPQSLIVSGSQLAHAGGSGALVVGEYATGVSALTGADAGNYVVASAGNTFRRTVITPKTVTFQLAGGSSTTVYGTAATLPSLALTGIVAGDAIGGNLAAFDGGTAFAISARTPAGTYQWGLSALTGAGADNYTVATSGNTAAWLSIARKPITWQVAAGTAIYGDALSNTTRLNGVLSGDTVQPVLSALTAGGSVDARPDAGGIYTAAVTGLDGAAGGNYVLQAGGSSAGNLVVTQRPLTYTVANAGSVYGTLATPGAVTLQNVVPGDTVGTTLGFDRNGTEVALTARTDAGSYRQRVTGVDDPNYVVAAAGNVPGTLTIARRQATFSTPDSDMVYGSITALRRATLGNVLAGDDVTAARTTYQYPWIDLSTLDAGAYAGTLAASGLTGADADNYEMSFAGSRYGTLNITPRPVTYSLALYFGGRALGSTVDYGRLRPNGSFEFSNSDGARATLDGVLQRDRFAVQMDGETTGMPAMPMSGGGFYTVGSYTWTGGTLSGPKAGNYAVAATGNTDVSVRIQPRALPVFMGTQGPAGAPAAAVYGSTDQYAPRATFSPASALDDVTASAVVVTPGGNLASLPARLDAGSYPVVMAGTLAGADAANYIAQPVQGTLQVTPKPITFSVADSRSTYGQQGVLGATTLTGVLAGDAVAVSGLDVTRNGANVAFSERSNAGSYGVTPAGLAGSAAGNYTLVPDGQALPDAGGAASRNGTHTVQTAPITLAYDPAKLSFTFGTPFALPDLGGVLFGDDVSVSATATPVRNLPFTPRGTRVLQDGLILDAQDYAMSSALSGAGSGNYHLTNKSASISVATKTLTTDFRDRTAVYGDYIGQQTPTLVGMVPGHEATATVSSTYGPRTGVGKHTETLYLSEGEHYNYNFPDKAVQVTVTPRPLVFTSKWPASMVYGDGFVMGELSGVLFDDDVRVGGTISGAGMPSQAMRPSRFGTTGNGSYLYEGRPNVGTYDYTADMTLVGGSAANYQPLPALKGTYAVTPRTLSWSVADTSFTYGGLKNCDSGRNCYAWEQIGMDIANGDRTGEAPQYGAIRFGNLVHGDTVTGKQALIDQVGRTGAISASLPAGPYYQVVTGIEGASAGNYVVGTNNTPGVLTVRPQWVAYNVTSGVFIPGLGMVGDPGKVKSLTVSTDKPEQPNTVRADLTAVVVARDANGKILTDLSALQAGRYTIRVEGFTGADAANYRVIGDGDSFRAYSQCGGDCVPWWSSRAGLLDVFADASLGLGLSKLEPVPKPPAILPTVEAPEGFFKVSSGLGPEFGRYDNVTGAAGNAEIGAAGGSAAGRVQAVAEGSVDLGNAQLSGQAGSAAEALIKFGVTGVKAKAEAGVHADGRIDSGAGFVMAGVQAGVEAEMEAGREGAKLAAEAIAGANAKGGADGDIGIGTGKADGTVSVFAYARSDNEWTFKDGKLVTKFDDSIGVGASAATSIGFSSGPGAVDAGVIVYSPGSLGGTFDFSGGFSDGTISLGIDLGAQIGIFGGGFSLNVSFDVTGFGRSLGDNSTVQAITNFFGFSIPGTAKPDPASTAGPAAASKRGNPQDRFSYMSQNPEWKNDGHNYVENTAFMTQYTTLQKRAEALVAREVNYQKTFLDLMKTDPQRAVDSLRNDSTAAMKADEVTLRNDLANMGLKMAMQDGKLVFINK